MMRHIHQHPSSVIVWLGDSPDAKQATHVLTEIARFVRFQNLWSGRPLYLRQTEPTAAFGDAGPSAAP